MHETLSSLQQNIQARKRYQLEVVAKSHTLGLPPPSPMPVVADKRRRLRGKQSLAAVPPSDTSAADDNQIALVAERALQIFADYHANGDALAWLEHTREKFEYYVRRLAMVEQRHARLRAHLSRLRATALVRGLREEGVRGLTATITRLRRPLPHAEGADLVFHYLYYFTQPAEAAQVREIDCWSGITRERHAGPGPAMPPPSVLRFMTKAEYDLRLPRRGVPFIFWRSGTSGRAEGRDQGAR